MTILILSGVLGFLLACLVALFLAPPLWRHAVRTTTKRLTQQSPRMMEEGQADRDQMRAEFAVTTRKLEVKVERIKEEADTQLIELSKTEKKRDRLQGKIESLETTLAKREGKIEKQNAKTDKLLNDLGKKSEQINTQSERLARQTEMLNTQASTLEKNVLELDAHKQKATEHASKEVDFSTKISNQDLQLSELRLKQQEIKLSHKSEDGAHRLEVEELNQKINEGLKGISELTQDLEARKQETALLRQEVGTNKEKINELIRDNLAKDKIIKQHEQYLVIAANAETKPSTPVETDINPGTAPDDSKIGYDTLQAATIIPTTLASPLTSIADNSNHDEFTRNNSETPASPPQRAQPIRRSRKRVKVIKTSESQSLAERIRALQPDHPKSM